ncbi:hypothetical protein GCM10010285_47800 [Streptomyces pseudogriseolus]|uniref:Uncharacterized protein n=1 Tax=Streptomyces pseudogriseolus TaxID=36817 RepID=A0ABQ2TEA7_STREZ|nr:hypothetical protein GCM10010285_47800 [Streptomyces rubiginosus]
MVRAQPLVRNSRAAAEWMDSRVETREPVCSMRVRIGGAVLRDCAFTRSRGADADCVCVSRSSVNNVDSRSGRLHIT